MLLLLSLVLFQDLPCNGFEEAKETIEKYIKLYEEAIIWGGILGASCLSFDFYFPIGIIGTIIFSLSIGIFYGVVAVSLAEVLNVLPIIHRRFNLNKGLQYFLLSLALGKAFGSILYNIWILQKVGI